VNLPSVLIDGSDLAVSAADASSINATTFAAAVSVAVGNGTSVGIYRPLDANRLPYAQQWNLTIEHQLTPSLAVTAAYVGNKGTRLPSRNAALNALNPSLLSMGAKLTDTF